MAHPSIAQYFFLFLVTSILNQSPSYQTQDPRLVDRIVRDSAFLSYPKHHKTSVLYNVTLPPGLHGATADIVRFRAGSLCRHGAVVKEFRFSPGVVVHPNMKRLVVIRQDLANHSSIYNSFQNLSGFSLVTPILGLLIYDAANLGSNHSKYPSELEVSVKKNPITVNFSSVVKSPEGQKLLCAIIRLNMKVTLSNLTKSYMCVSWWQGHFGLVVKSPLVRENNDTRTRGSLMKVVVTTAVGGALVVALLGLVVVAMISVKRKRALIAEMERRAYEDEALQMSMVGHVRAPTASVARTAPALENDYHPCL